MSWPVAVLAAVAQLKRERRVTDVGHRELKRALIRGDLQASSLLGGADGGGGDDNDDDDENENENDEDLPALAEAPEELLSALVREAEMLEVVATATDAAPSSSSSASSSSSSSSSSLPLRSDLSRRQLSRNSSC